MWTDGAGAKASGLFIGYFEKIEKAGIITSDGLTGKRGETYTYGYSSGGSGGGSINIFTTNLTTLITGNDFSRTSCNGANGMGGTPGDNRRTAGAGGNGQINCGVIQGGIYTTLPLNEMMLESDDLIKAVSVINTSGPNKVKVKGKTSQEEQESQEIYLLDVIKHEGNMVLDGTKTYEGATLDEENKIYQFGDVNLATNNTVVLKIEGDLIINENVTLTSVDAPKGLFVYCTGKLINEGTITMTGKGGNTSAGQNVYLYKKKDGSFEFIPATGGTGGAFSGFLVAYDGKQSDLNRGLAGGGGSADGHDGGHNGANATSWTSGAGGNMCGRTEQEQKQQVYL